MRVAWVHPSWRDVVIDDLAARPEARRVFLERCELPGVLLALSTAGGPRGDRALPLLLSDADWDALGDAVHRVAVAASDDDLAGLLLAVARAREVRYSPELGALAEALLGTCRRRWNAERRPIDVDLLEAWLELRSDGFEHVPLPELDATWLELVPAAQEAGTEQWLRFVELLDVHAPEVLPAREWARRDAQRAKALPQGWDAYWPPDEPPLPPAGPVPHRVRRILADL